MLLLNLIAVAIPLLVELYLLPNQLKVHKNIDLTNFIGQFRSLYIITTFYLFFISIALQIYDNYVEHIVLYHLFGDLIYFVLFMFSLIYVLLRFHYSVHTNSGSIMFNNQFMAHFIFVIFTASLLLAFIGLGTKSFINGELVPGFIVDLPIAIVLFISTILFIILYKRFLHVYEKRQ